MVASHVSLFKDTRFIISDVKVHWWQCTPRTTVRFRSRFNLISLPRGRLVCLCIVDCLIIVDFILQIAWNHTQSCLPMYRRMFAYVSQITCLDCHFNYDDTIVLWFRISYCFESYVELLTCVSHIACTRIAYCMLVLIITLSL